jgi:hypothetical protein
MASESSLFQLYLPIDVVPACQILTVCDRTGFEPVEQSQACNLRSKSIDRLIERACIYRNFFSSIPGPQIGYLLDLILAQGIGQFHNLDPSG